MLHRSLGLRPFIPPLHHTFTGNPGTGKTTVAMKMGEMYKAMGIISTGHTVIATRADLVGQYVGHTGPKTKDIITKSFGGILFIDEAYGLYKGEDSRDYGSEVINLLVKFMDTMPNGEFVVMLAGYKDQMTKLLKNNLGLMSRMGNWIDFPDYNDDELVLISQLLARKYGYSYDRAAQYKFLELMRLRKEFPFFSNARTVRNAMERARRISATRTMREVMSWPGDQDIELESLQTIKAEDFQQLIDEISPLPRDTLLS